MIDHLPLHSNLSRRSETRLAVTTALVPARPHIGQRAKSKAITAFKEFAGRLHYTVGQPGWEAIADFALS
jgi:hypothetical protein